MNQARAPHVPHPGRPLAQRVWRAGRPGAWAAGVLAVALGVVIAAGPVAGRSSARPGQIDVPGLAAPAASVTPESVTPASVTPASPLPSAIPKDTITVVSDTTTGTLEATGATWELHLPRLAGPLDPAVLASVNAVLAAGATADLAAFEAGSTKPVDVARSVDAFLEDFTVALLTPDLLSLRVLVSQYASGAAHGATAFEPWTFDLRTGDRLELADLFLPDAAYLRPIATFARHDLLAKHGNAWSPRQWVRDGTKPRPRNYPGWAMTPAGLEITFGQYQVAPYAEGMPVVVIPWSEFAEMLDPAGPAGSFAVTPVPSGPPAQPSASPAPVG
jgi:hypothetical protein